MLLYHTYSFYQRLFHLTVCFGSFHNNLFIDMFCSFKMLNSEGAPQSRIRVQVLYVGGDPGKCQ